VRPAGLLDRDGTIAEEVGYLNQVSRLRLLPGVAAAIRTLNEAELPVIVVTKQSGVGRGYFPELVVKGKLAWHAQKWPKQPELVAENLGQRRGGS
jgi:histidinol phosphatase-like enzyme